MVKRHQDLEAGGERFSNLVSTQVQFYGRVQTLRILYRRTCIHAHHYLGLHNFVVSLTSLKEEAFM